MTAIFREYKFTFSMQGLAGFLEAKKLSLHKKEDTHPVCGQF